MNPAQPPEGILDPQQPYWPADKVGEITWLRLKGKLTGRRVEGISENFTSYVKLGDADADRLIANIKKWGKYPTVNQNDKYGGALNNEAYQKWLVEEFLEKPFREETDKKIEEAEQEARLKEIVEQRKKDKESVPLPPITKEEEQEELDQDQEVLQDKIDDLTEDIDSELPEPEEKSESIEPNKPQPEETESPDGIEAIKDSLSLIKGSLQSQVTDLQVINQNDSLSLSSLETLKKLFETQNSIFKGKVEDQETQQEEAGLEQTKDVSEVAEATDLTADNKAQGIIQGVDGPVLTVKTTEGEFKQGEKISQGNTGGGFLDMIKGIAGKFLGGKGGGAAGGGGGAAPPTKLSSGGFLNTPYPAPMAEGGMAPGVYNKPTRGNLGMNQMVIPLNRNVGKPFRQDKNNSELRKKDQPMIDVMSQPLKAIGLSILTVAGNFLKALGPLGGFFAPYVSGLVKGFSVLLGVPGTIVMGLLGGPAYAAMEDQDKQQNIFVKLWNDLMKKFGFDLGDDEKDKRKKSDKPGAGKIIQGGDADFWSLAAVASLEGINSQGEADVAQVVYNRVASGAYSVKTIKDAVLSPGQFQPTREGDASLWAAIKDRESAIAAVNSNPNGRRHAEKYVDEAASNITNASLQKDAAEFVGGRTDFAVPSAANKYPGGFGYKERHGHLFGWYVGPGSIAYGKTNPGPASVPNFPISAESGTSISSMNPGKVMGWSIIEGPNSGYDVGPNLEMHGKEAYLQHENAISILPIENNKYSLTKNPEKTINRWKEILGSNTFSNGVGGYESGGMMDARRAHAAKLKAKRASEQRARLGVQKVDGKWTNMGVSDQAVGSNPWWQVWNKKGATKERRAKQEALASSLATRLNSQEGNGRRTHPTAPANPLTPRPRASQQSSTAGAAAKPEPVKTETDIMMEQYNQLIAAGKQTEAKELGMNIWNKTWKKTEKGLERIPSTPITATAATKSQPTPIQQTTSTAFSGVSVVSSPPPPVTYSFPQMSDSKLEFKTIVERSFG